MQLYPSDPMLAGLVDSLIDQEIDMTMGIRSFLTPYACSLSTHCVAQMRCTLIAGLVPTAGHS